MSKSYKEIRDEIEDYKDTLITYLTDLIAAKTENLPGNETEACNVLREIYKEWGVETYNQVTGDNRENLFTEIGSTGPRILLAGHTDVVPAGDGWESDPFQAFVKGDRLYGRGTCDNKGPFVSCMIAAKFLLDQQFDQATIVLGAFADEEKGSTYGMQMAIDENIFTADLAIVPDIGQNMEIIDIAEKGRIEIEVTALGKQGHGAYPDSGVNAIHLMSQFIAKLYDNLPSSKSHPLVGQGTCNAGIIEGGSAANTIPSVTTCILDFRLVPGQSTESILEHLEGIAKDIGEFKFKVTSDIPFSEVKPDHPMIPILQKITKDAIGKEPKIVGINGATVAKNLILGGVPAIGFAPGDHDQFHVANESVCIPELLDYAAIIVKAIMEYSDQNS